MRFKPQRASLRRWINSNFLPPRSFIAVSMDLAMMSAAQRDDKLITDLAAQVLGFEQSVNGERRRAVDRKRGKGA